MDSPKISVIVPVYNAEKYLHRCIDSILAQTFSDFELLLIDDGSTDKSGDICDEYAKKDKRIRVFHKENGGVSSARNVGLDNARGEWITFCDADDWVEKDWLLKFSKDFDIDIVVQGFYIHEKGNVLKNEIPINVCGKYHRTNYAQYLDFLNEVDNVGYLWCRLFRKDIIDKNRLRFVEEYVLWEDLNFIFRYLIHTEASLVQENVCYHYIRPNFSSKYLGKQYTLSTLKCLYDIICCYISLAEYCKNKLLVSLANQYINCMIHICRNGSESYHVIREYSRFVMRAIVISQCEDSISLKSKMFLMIDSIPNINVAKLFNTIVWKVLRKPHLKRQPCD